MATSCSLALTLLCLVVSVASVRAVHPPQPWYCKVQGFECPRFYVLERSNSGLFELRNYTEDSYWIATTVKARHYTEAIDRSLDYLGPYFKGHNSDGVEIPWGLPTRVRIYQEEKYHETKDEYVVAQYVPQEDAPQPKSEDVDFMRQPAGTKLMVSPVNGQILKQEELLQGAAQIAEQLKIENIRYEHAYFEYDVYESPVAITGFHQEIVFEPQRGREAQPVT